MIKYKDFTFTLVSKDKFIAKYKNEDIAEVIYYPINNSLIAYSLTTKIELVVLYNCNPIASIELLAEALEGKVRSLCRGD